MYLLIKDCAFYNLACEEDLEELYLNSGPDSTLHPLDKREIQLYSPVEDDEEHWQELPSSYGYVVSQPDADYLISPRQESLSWPY